MRVPSQCGAVRIVSAAGELRDARVSGFEKARVRWLFRNFGALQFSVLNEKQRQLIAGLWHAEPATGCGNPSAVIGTIEGFSPHSYPPAVVARSGIPQRQFHLRAGLHNLAAWAAIGAMVVGVLFLGTKYRSAQPQRSLAAVERIRAVTSTASLPPPLSTQPASPVPGLAAVPSAASSPVYHAQDRSAAPSTPLMSPAVPEKKTGAAKTLSLPQASREVILRASIDTEGRSQSLQVLRGDRRLIPTALEAAKRWHFQPCSRTAGCEQLLKFMDYGDASSMQLIDECPAPAEDCFTEAAHAAQ